jgi:hypothetical protein
LGSACGLRLSSSSAAHVRRELDKLPEWNSDLCLKGE